MGQLKDLKPAGRPPHLPMETEIHAPIVNNEGVNGKPKYSITPARPGVITIFSDGENEEAPSSRPRSIKRERSQVPRRAVKQGHQSTQEYSGSRHKPQQTHGQSPPAAAASDTRRTQVHKSLRRGEARGRSDPPSDSPTSSDPSESEGSDSSESEDESDSSSESSSSEGSSSEDEANASVYQPTTPASSIGSTPPRTRGRKDTGVRGASASLVTASPFRQSMQNEASRRSRHASLEFFINLPTRLSEGRPELAARPQSHISSAVAPEGAHVERAAHSSHHPHNNNSPVVLGFIPVNRGSPPPHAPTEPRAMRIGDPRPASTPVHPAQRPSESTSMSASGSSSLPFRGPRVSKDNSQQKGQQRRGPTRPGRIMQTIEQPAVEILSTRSPPKNALSSRDSKAATPGPSSRRTAPPPPATPGIFATPRAVSVRPHPVARNHDTSQSVSRPQGKRTFDETEDTDSTSKAAEWERMLERIKNHDREMEQQRAQLEETKRLLAEQKSRIDDLEQRRRAEELVQHDSVQTRVEEPDVAPLPDVIRRDASPAPVPCHQAERREERRQQNTCQAERRDKRNRRRSSRVARARLQEQERERIEQERQEDLELEQQLEQEQLHQAERIQCAVRNLQDNAQQGHAQPRPAQRRPEVLAAVQRRIQHDVFNRPLSGHNLRIIFDDDDRPHISEATAFLMRLPQSFVLARLRRLVEGKEFFDTAHLGSTHLGCWVVSRRASCDLRMKLTDSGESHNISFARLAVRLWHDEQSIYSLLQHHNHQLKAWHTCHVDACMRPDHIVVESDRAAGERRNCKARGRCYGHRTVLKDGTSQVRKPCVFPPRGASVRQ